MREAAMMRERESAAAKASENIEVGRFCGKRQGQSGKRSFAIEPGAA